jgi:hypothetical protein
MCARLAPTHRPPGTQSPCQGPTWQARTDLGRMDAEFRTLYPGTSNRELAKLFNVSLARVETWAARLKVHKDPDYRREVQRANARKRRLTEAQRAALGAKARGRRMSPETKAKIHQTKLERGSVLRGSDHPNWKGGRPWERFRDERYLRWRNAVLERDGYRCRNCGRQCKKLESGLAAHHIRPYATDVAARYVLSNGLTLCRACHMELHGHPLPPPVLVACGCGCGQLIAERDVYGRPRRYVNHHHVRGRKHSEETKRILRDQRRGKSLGVQHRARISLGLRKSSRRIGRPPKH